MNAIVRLFLVAVVMLTPTISLVAFHCIQNQHDAATTAFRHRRPQCRAKKKRWHLPIEFVTTNTVSSSIDNNDADKEEEEEKNINQLLCDKNSDSANLTPLANTDNLNQTPVQADESKQATEYSPRNEKDFRRQNLSASETMAALGTTPRRVAVSLVSATTVALIGNLFGVTSRVLTWFPETTVERTGLDTYFPRGDYKRVSTPRYTFRIPKEWVADTSLELAKTQARAKSLDLTMTPRKSSTSTSNRLLSLPDVAYGPPGGGGKKRDLTNVSVIVSAAGARPLSSLGTPTEAAESLLQNTIAPAGSGKEVTLLDARETPDGFYQFEFVVNIGQGKRLLRNISVIARRKDELISLTVVAPNASMENNDQYSSKLRNVVSSFHLR